MVRVTRKPNSVSGMKTFVFVPGNDHSSGLPIARQLVRPTREFERAALKHSPIWSCTGWGLPSFPGHPGNWCALTTPFHPYRPQNNNHCFRALAVYFLLHFPSCRHDSTLWSTLPCGVRTFLRTDKSIRRSFELLRPSVMVVYIN